MPRRESKTNSELRPIGARALKSAGDTLRPFLSGSRVLDLFAGEGRFGIVALEEGAREVTFVENHRATAQELRRTLARYGEQAIVASLDVFAYLEARGKKGERFDLIFADPPFPDWSQAFETKLFSAAVPHLVAEGIFLVKHPSRVLLSACPETLKRWKSVVFGESTLAYFRYAPNEVTE